MKRLALVIGLLGLALLLGQATHATTPTTIHAQATDSCDTLITAALQEIGTACVENGRNETCYGNVLVSATLSDSALAFRDTGDIVPVTAIEALFTRSADPDTGEWGVALMDIEADLPDDADGLVRMVLFGGVEITPATDKVIPDAPTCAFTNTNASNLNMRGGPGLAYRVVDVLNTDETIEVYGQSDNEWLRSARGWFYGPLGELDCADDIELQTMNDPNDAYIAPMQAFSMTIDDSGQCRAAPPGLLIQTPDRTTATILINNVEIRAGSTAFVTGDSDTMVVANLEGDVRTRVNDSTTIVPVGAQVDIPVDENGEPSSATRLRPIQGNAANLDPRILNLLPIDVDIPQPAILIQPSGAGTGAAGDAPGQWLGCGSCATCGHPADECVTSPDGACLWDPTSCTAPAPDGTAAGIVCSPACAGTYQCPIGDDIFFTVTYIPIDDEEIDLYEVFSTPPGEPINITDLGGSGNTFSFKADCITFGAATVIVQVIDSSGISFTKNFTIQGVAGAISQPLPPQP